MPFYWQCQLLSVARPRPSVRKTRLFDINAADLIFASDRAGQLQLCKVSFEQSEHDKELLHLLAKGEREIGISKGYDLEAVLAEADLILSGNPS